MEAFHFDWFFYVLDTCNNIVVVHFATSNQAPIGDADELFAFKCARAQVGGDGKFGRMHLCHEMDIFEFNT